VAQNYAHPVLTNQKKFEAPEDIFPIYNQYNQTDNRGVDAGRYLALTKTGLQEYQEN
jgi:hypothetical protein